MKLSKNIMSVLALVVVVGAVFMFSGCAATCGAAEKTSAPVKAAGTLRGAMGVDDCEKSSSPLFIEKVMPGQIVVGKPYQYTIHVSNNAKCVLTDVVVTEEVPEQYDLQTATPQPTKTSGRVLLWELGTLKSGETKVITITGSAKTAGSTVSCTKADYNPILCLGPEAISPNLKLALQVASKALLCDVIPAKVTITNSGTGYAQNAVVSVPLPSGLTTTDGKTSASINVGSLAGGDSKAYNINLKAQKPGSYDVKASAKAASGLSAASNSASVDVIQPKLAIAVQGPGKIFVTKTATYKVQVENRGNAASASTVATASIPSGMKFVKASNGGSVSGGVVTWNIGTLEAGKAVSLDTTFLAMSDASGQSYATAKGYCCQEVTAAAQTAVSGVPALLLEAIDVVDPIQVGGTEKYYVTVTNQGSAPDTNIVIEVGFEKQLDYVSAAGPTKPATVDAKKVKFAPLASLAPGQKATWEVVAKAISEGDHRTSVKMTSDVLTRSVDETESTNIY